MFKRVQNTNVGFTSSNLPPSHFPSKFFRTELVGVTRTRGRKRHTGFHCLHRTLCYGPKKTLVPMLSFVFLDSTASAVVVATRAVNAQQHQRRHRQHTQKERHQHRD